MVHPDLNRRQFLQQTVAAAMAGGTLLSPLTALSAAAKPKRTAADQVELGHTGIKLSRLGFGTGSNSGNVQRNLGQAQFNRLIRYAYDHGITYLDTAESYRTHEWIGEAIKGLPREKLFIQTKMPGNPEKPLERLDAYRKAYQVDYLDSVLMHCMTTKAWPEDQRRLMDALAEAQDRKIIRAKGVSCHSLPALSRASESSWVNVNLVRFNPQGRHLDTPKPTWNATSSAADLPGVARQIETMRKNGHGVIGMKLIGDGDFKQPEQREKSIRFVLRSGLVDAVVIGFASTGEIDEAIERIDRALAEA